MKFITSEMKENPSDLALNYIFKVYSLNEFLAQKLYPAGPFLLT